VVSDQWPVNANLSFLATGHSPLANLVTHANC